MEDADLVRSYREGDESSFDEIVRRHAAPLYRFSRRMLSDSALAEDCVQETFIKAWKAIDRFDDSSGSLKPWLFAIARNSALDILRKRKGVPLSVLDTSDAPLDEVIEADDPQPDELFARKELADALESAIGELSIDRRTIVLMHGVEGMTFEEISSALDMPMNTAKSHFRRAVAVLRSRLGEKDGL